MRRRLAAFAAGFGAVLAFDAAAQEADRLAHFEQRLRDALDEGSLEAMLPLVQLPLRVNGAQGAGRTWRFEADGETVKVEEPRCEPDPPPERARARVGIAGEGAPREAWCY